jgi:hypothetical protein
LRLFGSRNALLSKVLHKISHGFHKSKYVLKIFRSISINHQ